jgi:drug/metabolite transporter (DMT)-like permease
VALTAIALLLGSAAVWGINDKILGLFHDDGVYTVVAKSLYQGDGYRIISLPTAPPQTKYPFLYSYLLSWIWAFSPTFPQNITALKSLNIAIFVAIFFLSVTYYRRNFPASNIAAIVFGLLVCTNPILFTFTDYVVSDLLYVLLVLGALTICGGGNEAFSQSRTLTLAIVSGLAWMTRLAAAPLIFAGTVQSVISQGLQGAAYFIGGVLLFIMPWLLWVSLQVHDVSDFLYAYYSGYDVSGSHGAPLGTWLVRHWPIILGNARYVLDLFDLLYLLPLLPSLGLVVAFLTITGMIVSVRKQELFAWCFFLSSVGLLLIWPFHPVRYVAPLVPLLIMFLFRGMHAVQCWMGSLRKDFALGGLVAKMTWLPALLILLLNGVWLSGYLLVYNEQTTRGLYGNRASYGWQGFEETFTWIRQNVPSDALLATAYDPMYYLYTGRLAIRPAIHRPATYFYPYGQATPDVGSVDEIRSQLEKLRINYLIVDPLDGYSEGNATLKLFDELVESYGAKMVFASTDGKHRVYALKSG